MRIVNGRPPVVLVAREGDPAAAIAVAVTTTGIGFTNGASTTAEGDPEIASALAGLLDARFRAKGIDAVVTPSWDGVRASALARTDTEAVRIAESLRETMNAPANDGDLVAARRKLVALGQQPLRDRALVRWARCVGQPHALPERAGKDHGDIDVARLERWRAGALGLGRMTVAVTGPMTTTEAVASAVLGGPAWASASTIGPGAGSADAARGLTERVDVLGLRPNQWGDPTHPQGSASPTLVQVFEIASEGTHVAQNNVVVYLTLDVGTSSAAVTTAEALGDPRGPLAARLAELDLPFRLREVTGAAHVRGGCVGVVLEAAPGPSAADGKAEGKADLAPRVADAVALVHLEARVHLAEMGTARDGRVLSRRSGDAREAAERAAWWALADRQSTANALEGSVALGIPTRALGRAAGRSDATTNAKELALEPSRDALAAAVTKAATAWDKPVVEPRSRVESGQGEVWVLLGSPCGTDGESDADAGLTALFTTAAAESVRAPNDVRVEPWVVADGAGVLAHGPALAGETAPAHARRIADIAARSFAAEPITNYAIARARTDLLRRDARNDGPALSVLASALAPQHSSWIIAWGSSEPLARSSDAAVLLRAQYLRTGPLRIAVLANTEASQADAAVRAADRWVARRTGDSRACRAPTTASPPKPGTYSVPPRPGAVPEAYLAFPLSPGDEAARAAAMVVAAGLDGDGGLLEKALAGSGFRESQAHVLGWPRAPALVVRIVAPQASLDSAVMQTRALVDRLHKGGLLAPDFERASSARARTALATSLDPRARVVATWRGEPIDGAATPRITAEDVRAFAQKNLAEDTMVVVASRPARPPTAALPTTP
jgi:hypothetical protein